MTLPTELLPQYVVSTPTEPATNPPKADDSTNCLPAKQYGGENHLFGRELLPRISTFFHTSDQQKRTIISAVFLVHMPCIKAELATGIEPVTSSLPRTCSTN